MPKTYAITMAAARGRSRRGQAGILLQAAACGNSSAAETGASVLSFFDNGLGLSCRPPLLAGGTDPVCDGVRRRRGRGAQARDGAALFRPGFQAVERLFTHPPHRTRAA